MTKAKSAKIIGGILFSMLLLMLFVVPSASAASPRLMMVNKTSPHAFLANVQFNKYRNKVVVLTFKLQDMKTGVMMFKTYATKMDKHGKSSVLVRGLKPSTNYHVWVKGRKITLPDYSKYSNRRDVMTKAAVLPAASATVTPSTTESTPPATESTPPATQ